MKSWYSRFSQTFSTLSGQPLAFGLAAIMVAAWLVVGLLFGFSDTWQLVMNTVSSIVTFLMVFIIQNTQNRQTEALQIKLDESSGRLRAREILSSISRTSKTRN